LLFSNSDDLKWETLNPDLFTNRVDTREKSVLKIGPDKRDRQVALFISGRKISPLFNSNRLVNVDHIRRYAANIDIFNLLTGGFDRCCSVMANPDKFGQPYLLS